MRVTPEIQRHFLERVPMRGAEMTEIILFFGAGASKPFGIPTTIDFVEEFAKEIKSEKFPDEQIEFYTLIQNLLDKKYKPME